MTLSYAADGGITGHLPQGVKAVGKQQGLAAHARGGKGSLGAGVTATYNNNIIFFKHLRSIFALLCAANDTGKAELAKQSWSFT